MTALSADTQRKVMDWGGGGSYPVLATTQIYKGSIVCVDANGYAIPATDTAAIYCVGVATENVLGGAASGDEWVKVEAGRAYLFAASSITQAMVGEPMYVVDDNTVDETSTNLCLVGVLVKYVSNTSGWVLVAPSYSLAVSGVTASAGELNYLDITGAGTVQASKAVVVDGNKDVASFRNVTVQNLDAGASGVVGTVDIFPTTAASGKLAIVCADQAANHTDTLQQDSTAAARTHHLTDMGADGYIVETTAALSLAEADVLQGATAGTAVASKALVADSNLQLAGLYRPVVLAKGTGNITAAESGTLFICAVDAVLSLPDCTTCEGAWYTFMCGALSGGTGLSISPAATDNIRYTGLTSVDNKDIINTGATDVVGDFVTMVSDGVDGWVVIGIGGIWAKE